MDNIPLIKGKDLDALALRLGLKRGKWFLFFKESDKSLRSRVECRVCQLSNKKLSVIGVKVV